VLSGRGLCDEPITSPEESYRLWCVVVCDDLENLKNEEAMTRVESQRQSPPPPKKGKNAIGFRHSSSRATPGNPASL